MPFKAKAPSTKKVSTKKVKAPKAPKMKKNC